MGQSAWKLRLIVIAGSLIVAVTHSPAAPRLEVRVVTGQELHALFVEKPVFVYPLDARRVRKEGSGLYRMFVGVDGRVQSIGIMKSTGSRTLDVAAAAGLIRARIKPGRRRQIDIPVAFELDR